METGLFTYVAHPDLFRFFGDADVYRREMRKICVAAKALPKGVLCEIEAIAVK